MKEFGGNINALLCERSDVLLIADSSKIGLYQYYCRAHFGTIPQFRETFGRFDRFFVYRPEPPPGPTKAL
jgi:hypothetical protein